MKKIHIPTWLDENRTNFLPPVCNKLMYSEGQMKLFFVGGPNQREDFHLEDGEELFFMWKGNMCLKVLEGQQHRDVVIKEGEILLLPSNIYHSPQRPANSIGWVAERERTPHEIDGLVYFTRDEKGEKTSQKLFERYTHIEDLGTQLAPIIREYFASEEHRTGRPVTDHLLAIPPTQYDPHVRVPTPFPLREWIQNHEDELHTKGSLRLFPDLAERSQFLVEILGKGDDEYAPIPWETWLWIMKGSCEVRNTQSNDVIELNENDCTLIPANTQCKISRHENTWALRCYQDASKSQRGDSK